MRSTFAGVLLAVGAVNLIQVTVDAFFCLFFNWFFVFSLQFSC